MLNAAEQEIETELLILYSKSLGFRVKTQSHSIQDKMRHI